MATQTIEFRSPPSQTITAKLFAVGSDTQVASVSTTEATNRKGTYAGAYTDVPAGEYELIALVSTTPVARWFVTLTLTTATFQVYDKSQTVLMVADVVNASALAADAVAEIQSGLATSAALATAQSDLATLTGRLTSARAGYLDNLNVGGAVASNSDILALNQSASRRIILTTVGQYERPEAGSTAYTIEARTYDGDGAAVNADTNPTLTVTGQTTGSLAANVGAITSPATGVYRWAYSQAPSATLEPIRVDVSATISASAFTLSAYTQSVDFVAATWSTTDSNNLTAIFNKLPSRSYIAGSTAATGAAVTADVGLATANLDTQLAALQSDTDNIQTRLPAALVSGRMAAELDSSARVKLDATQPDYAPATSSALAAEAIKTTAIQTSLTTALARLGAWTGTGINTILGAFRALAAKAAALTPTDLSAGTTYSNVTDSLEAIKDAGGSTATIVTLQSVAGISPGVIVGPSEPLVIGDDYLTTLNRSFRVNLLDSSGDPATVVFGSFSLADVDCSIKLLLRKSGKPTAVAQITGTCTFFPAVGDVPPYLIVEFTRTQTALATPGAYDMQAEARWTAGQNVTFAPYGQVEFVRDIQR